MACSRMGRSRSPKEEHPAPQLYIDLVHECCSVAVAVTVTVTVFVVTRPVAKGMPWLTQRAPAPCDVHVPRGHRALVVVREPGNFGMPAPARPSSAFGATNGTFVPSTDFRCGSRLLCRARRPVAGRLRALVMCWATGAVLTGPQCHFYLDTRPQNLSSGF